MLYRIIIILAVTKTKSKLECAFGNFFLFFILQAISTHIYTYNFVYTIPFMANELDNASEINYATKDG